MPWIRTIDPEDADGRLAELYAWQAAKLGRPPSSRDSAASTPRSSMPGW